MHTLAMIICERQRGNFPYKNSLRVISECFQGLSDLLACYRTCNEGCHLNFSKVSCSSKYIGSMNHHATKGQLGATIYVGTMTVCIKYK